MIVSIDRETQAVTRSLLELVHLHLHPDALWQVTSLFNLGHLYGNDKRTFEGSNCARVSIELLTWCFDNARLIEKRKFVVPLLSPFISCVPM